MQIAATQILSSQPQWHAASLALQNGVIPKLTIPIASAAELGQIGQHLQIKLTPEHLQALAKANINLSVHFDTSHEAVQPAYNVLSSVLAARPVTIASPTPLSASPAPQSITVLQGAEGGAIIGGIGGAGVALLVQSLKTTADTLTNPVVGTVASVLIGIAAGAASGAVFAKATKIGLTVSPTAVTVSAESPAPSA